MAGNLFRGRLHRHGKGSDKAFEVEQDDAEWRTRRPMRPAPSTAPSAPAPVRSTRNTIEGGALSLRRLRPQPLFTAATKFNSGSGWPSFYEPMDDAVETTTDTSFFMTRTEVHCKNAADTSATRLDDGPQPTGQRWP